VLRFIAEHTGVAFDRNTDFEVVYNTYDWGLNDSRRAPHLGPILFHESVEHFAEADGGLRELYLYEGNFCNRTCAWCTINGSPGGTYHPYNAAVLDQAIATIAVDGNLKFYGGEPTLHADDVIDAIRYVRPRLQRPGFDLSPMA
jgi:sulfatase maturation enzyme AslB (radical SAM superfamily)